MFTTLMIVSLDQGRLDLGRRRIGQFDAHLLRDIGYEECAVPHPKQEARHRARAVVRRWLAGLALLGGGASARPTRA